MTFNSKLEAFLSKLTPDARNAFMVEAVRQYQQQQEAANATDYTSEDGIVRFVRDVLLAEPTDYQERILRALVKHKKICVRAPHGAGKTALSSWVTIWGMMAFSTDVKVVTTASAWRQLERYTWPEIRKWAAKANLASTMRILNLSLEMPGKQAFAVASDNPALIEGAHASTLIYVFDESKSIQNGVFEAAEGAFSGAGADTGNRAYALAISTPGDTAGVFYDIQTRRKGYEEWHAEHITLEECIAAGRISREWAESKKNQWGENSAPYRNRVLGEFADTSESSLIPLSWVEAAHKRFDACNGRGMGSVSYGLDPARFGEDATCTAKLVGRCLESITYANQQNTMQTVGNMVITAPDKQTPIGVDVVGLGAGVYDRLKELGYSRAKAVNAGASAKDAYGNPIKDDTRTLEFHNKRSQLWWALRDALNPEGESPLALPPDDRLTGDLTAPTFWFTSTGKIQVESKDDIRERIGRSPDAADALALALEAARDAKGAILPMPYSLGSGAVLVDTAKGTKRILQDDGWLELPIDQPAPVDPDTAQARRLRAGIVN